jgi:hypothetical protein
MFIVPHRVKLSVPVWSGANSGANFRARVYDRTRPGLGAMTTKKLLLAAVLLTAIAAPAEARKAKAPKFVGEWCLTQSVTGGYETWSKRYISREYFFSRNMTDCPAEKRVTLEPHSLRGLDFTISDDGDELIVEGWPKPKIRR